MTISSRSVVRIALTDIGGTPNDWKNRVNAILAVDSDSVILINTTAWLDFAPSRRYNVRVMTDTGFSSEGTFSSPCSLPDN